MYCCELEMLQIGVFTDFRLEMSTYFSKFWSQTHTRKRITLTSAPGLHRFQTLATALGGLLIRYSGVHLH